MKFPSPLEVNRFISRCCNGVRRRKTMSFRPLSRYIGLYPENMSLINELIAAFPPPLEVYRFISNAELYISKYNK